MTIEITSIKVEVCLLHNLYTCKDCLAPMVGVSNGMEYRSSGYVDKYAMAKKLLESVGFKVERGG